VQSLLNNKAIDYKIAVRELMPNNSVNFPKIINHGLPLAVLLQTAGAEDTYRTVGLMIAKFCGAFNVVRNMTPEQIVDYSFTLVNENMSGSLPYNPSYRLEDLAVFFERAKTGRYGKPFDHIDASVIEGMLDKYHEERLADFDKTQFLESEIEEELPLTPEQEANSKKLLAELVAKAVENTKVDVAENSFAERELIRLECIERKKQHFFGEEKYKELFENEPNDVMIRIAQIKKVIENANEKI
jgi:hypothetical protein